MSFLNRFNRILTILGIPGLFLIAFLDSAAVPMAGGPDAVVLLLAWKRPGLLWLIAAAAAAGSTLGCLVLYRIGRAGGSLALSRFSESKQEWVRAKLDRHAFWTVFLAVVLPPPFPTKPIILGSGVFRMRLNRFTAGVLTGRLLRFGTWAYMAGRFGSQAASMIREHAPAVLACVTAGILVALLANWLLRRRSASCQPGQHPTPRD